MRVPILSIWGPLAIISTKLSWVNDATWWLVLGWGGSPAFSLSSRIRNPSANKEEMYNQGHRDDRMGCGMRDAGGVSDRLIRGGLSDEAAFKLRLS